MGVAVDAVRGRMSGSGDTVKLLNVIHLCPKM